MSPAGKIKCPSKGAWTLLLCLFSVLANPKIIKTFQCTRVIFQRAPWQEPPPKPPSVPEKRGFATALMCDFQARDFKHAPSCKEDGEGNNKICIKKIRWTSASWTFFEINELFSWEHDNGNRCSRGMQLRSFFIIISLSCFIWTTCNHHNIFYMF